MKNIIIFSRNNFPDGDAGAIRDYSFAKLYLELGFNVICFCLNNSIFDGIYNGIEFHSLYIKKNNIIDKISSEFGYKNRLISTFNKIKLNLNQVAFFHIVDIPINAILFLKVLAKRYEIKLIHDSVEWYSPSNFKNGIFSFGYINKNILNKYIITNQFKVIAISKFLENYFVNKGIITVRVPVIIYNENQNFKYDFSENGKLNILYAGSPGLKDSINIILKSIACMDLEVQNRLHFNFIGMNIKEINEIAIKNSIKLSSISNLITIHGRKSREYVFDYLRKSDFSILLRPSNERYAKAGFPTKVVESMNFGVPVICNYSSDLKDYLVDEWNSAIVNSYSITELTKVLIKITSFDRNTLEYMHKNAINTSNKFFNPINYLNIISDFLEFEGD